MRRGRPERARSAEDPAAATARTRPSLRNGAHIMTPPSSPDELTTVFAHLQGMLLSTQDATAAVHQLARAAHRMVPAAAGAGVSLIDETGTRVTAAATDTVVEAADALQYELGQGPCLSAWATREPQHVADTAQDPRWTRWQAAAAASGIRSVLSTPLVHRNRGLGAMKVYATAPGAFTEAEERLLRLLADAAATLMGTAQAADAPVRLSASLKAALQSRETVALAAGVLMSRRGLDAEAAREALLADARARGRSVAESAADVLETGRDR